MNAFLEEVYLILPVIGVDYFKIDNRQTNYPAPEDKTPEPDVYFMLEHPGKGIKARAKEDDGEFVMPSGSRGDINESASFHEKLRVLREKLLKSERAKMIGTSNFELTEDVAFSSPSAASVFLFGTSRNGRNDWLVEGKSVNYGKWKANQLKAATQDIIT